METEKNVITKAIRLKPDVVKKVESMAEKDNRSFNNMVETILMNCHCSKH